MFTKEMKKMIAREVEMILLKTQHPELPNGKISFLLHVDGAENWSWTNICNNGAKIVHVPESLIRNTSISLEDSLKGEVNAKNTREIN